MDEHEKMRRQLWIDIARVVAGAVNCTKLEAPGNWADVALAAFDKQFQKPKPEEWPKR